ncbi:hypothetical protein CupriaWKF_31075 [Cupriavidus sp. WKF15]|uniref:hypothetical protein n=1 Tax=Cupriavidus sp. WKF15 TaxID=3032282 RepID=UPI0023E09404|nr:hypothetical protein [Cupriavidus sp. WKF15]WER50797.1 hypothetical protein CupriaWKF_31075 [Cupriavidus sp. WKF15]
MITFEFSKVPRAPLVRGAATLASEMTRSAHELSRVKLSDVILTADKQVPSLN